MTRPASDPKSADHDRLLDALDQILRDPEVCGFARHRDARRAIAGELLADLRNHGFDVVRRAA